jgi:hypothetical protein
MMSEEHETLAALISSLNIRRYQNLLGGPLDETKRHAMQARLKEEEVWMKNHTPPFCAAPVLGGSYAGTTRGILGLLPFEVDRNCVVSQVKSLRKL